MTMVNHPNRSKRLDKDTRLVQARAADFEAKRQQAKHTPGPWRVYMTANQVPIITSDRGDVAVTRANGNNANGIEEANARLIAAAPELLAALKAARPHIGVGYSAIQRHAITSQVDAAIAKAEGR